MTKELDYKLLGLKCGLEIHQQLNTNKLFCNCPSIIRDDKAHFIVKRYLRALAGESGTVDVAALDESKKQKYFLYEGYTDTTCLVELDEEPPHSMNKDALFTTLQFSKMINAKVVDNIRVMRKTVIDGSNTSGFQRTSLVAIGGSIMQGKVAVESVCLEEDACKIVEKKVTHNVYNLSRLGIPLIEIATAPDITSPEMAKEVASELGMLLRSTGRVMRGLGTIRQDVNVSIVKGVRVEIKGAQDLKLLPTYVAYESLRQKNLLEIFSELKKRKASAQTTIHNLSKLFAKTEAKILRSALDKKEKDGVVLAIKLNNYAGFIGKEIQPGRRLGSEFSDYAKMHGVKGLFHSDELPHYGITQKEVDLVVRELHIGKNDAFILIADQKDIARRAIEQVIERANRLKLIKEVRQARPDGTSQYMRPMPGASRMYPETDVPAITPQSLDDIALPELITEKAKRFAKKYKLSTDLANLLAKGGYDFDVYVKDFKKVNPTVIADTLLTTPKELKKRFNIEIDDVESYEGYAKLALEKLNEGLIASSSLVDILSHLCKNESVKWENYAPMDEKALEKVVKEVISADPKAPIGALMGQAMKKIGGSADGKLVMLTLKKFLKR